MSRKNLLLVGSIYTLLLAGLVMIDVALTSSVTVIPEYAKRDIPPPPGQGVRIERSPDVPKVLSDLEMTTKDTTEKSLLSRIVPETILIRTQVILLGDDRLALLSYVESPDVRAYFFGLKDALQASFSAQLTDLVDITETPDGHPTRNILSFRDPALSEEKLVFIRVRERLYELHVAAGKEETVQKLMNALTE